MSIHRPSHSSEAVSGALAGCVTTVVFTVVHHMLISNIWFSLIPMLVMGGICGASLAWSYGILFRMPAISTWLMYNSAYLVFLVLLGIASFLVYDPIVTTAALIAADEPPGELIAKALPLTLLFWLGSVGAMSLMWGRTLRKVIAMLVTSAIIVGLFGLNISVIGLVEFSPDGSYLVGLFFGLIAAIIGVNAATFVLIERGRMFKRDVASVDARDAVQAPIRAGQGSSSS